MKFSFLRNDKSLYFTLFHGFLQALDWDDPLGPSIYLENDFLPLSNLKDTDFQNWQADKLRLYINCWTEIFANKQWFFSDDDFAGQLECARLWFEAFQEQDPNLVAGMMIGDSLGKSGASQIHPHMQTWIGEQFEGQFASLYKQATQYREQSR